MATGRPKDSTASRWKHRSQPSVLGRLTQAWALLAIVGLLTALAAACGGGGEPQAEGSPTPSPTAEDGALAPCKAAQALKAYRYSANVTLESPEPAENPPEPRPTPTSTLTREFTGPFLSETEFEISFVAPDRFKVLSIVGGSETALIVVGDQTWVELNGSWMPASQGYDVPFTPSAVCEAILVDIDLSLAEPQEEEVNGVNSLHYTFAQVHSEQAMGKIFGPGSDMDILLKELDVDLWLAAEGNWPVRVDIRSSGLYADGRELRAHLLVDVRDANSPDIQVEPPS